MIVGQLAGAARCFSLIACGGNGLQDPGAADMAVAGAVTDAAKGPEPDLADPNAISISIGPIMLAAGEERTVCTWTKLPTTTDIDIVRIDGALLPGSHHLIIYKSIEAENPVPTPCQPLDVGLGGGKTKNIPLYIAETQSMNNLPLPTGVANHLPAGQMIKMEAHYINSSPNAISAMGTITLTPGVKGQTYIPADIMFCGSVLELYTKGVPPGATSLSPGFWVPPKGVKVFGVTTHEHKRGTDMTLAKSTSAADPVPREN